MIKLSEIDMNLLVVFDLLYQEQNTQRVARRLGITQPAISHALKRLRTVFGDELFERTSRGLMPTPLASDLHPSIAEALALLQETLNRPDDFAPQSSRRTFTIAMTDIGEIIFLPRLLERLSREAPGVALSTVRSHSDDLKREMEDGHVDLAIGLIPQLGAGFYQQRYSRSAMSACCVVAIPSPGGTSGSRRSWPPGTRWSSPRTPGTASWKSSWPGPASSAP